MYTPKNPNAKYLEQITTTFIFNSDAARPGRDMKYEFTHIANRSDI